MKTKQLYVRDGRRFVKLPTIMDQHTTTKVGMYYNEDGSFSEEKTQFSIGLCINEDVKTISIVHLNYYPGVNWISAKNWAEAQFNGKGHLPSRLEGAQIIEFHKKLPVFEHNLFIWTSLECGSDLAWYWGWYSSYSFVSFDGTNKDYVGQDYCALSILTLNK